MTDQPVLEVKHLNTWYREGSSLFSRRNRRQVLKDVSLTIHEGEVLGVVGESGSGKSTLAKAILGMLDDYEGEIIHHTKRPQMVFQDPYSALNPVRTIRWILEEPLKIYGKYNAAERRQRVIEALEKVGLGEEYLERKPPQLSGGQRQRICIALALIVRPKLVIADEAVSALDVTIQAQILELMKELKNKVSASIIMITHDLGIVSDLCDRVNVMYGSQLMETGTVDDLFYRTAHPYTRGLLNCLPDATGENTKDRLEPINGAPVDLMMLPEGCAFASRCDNCMKLCIKRRPDLIPVGEAHKSRCWLSALNTGE